MTRFTPKRRFQILLLPIGKYMQIIFYQAQTKPQRTLEFELNKSEETFSSNTSLEMKEYLSAGLTNSEVFKFVFNITEKITNMKRMITKSKTRIMI